jgi:uncharacterized protein (DUF302 family)
MTNGGADGIERVASRHSLEETIRRIEEHLRVRGITLFARIDHSAEAAKVGLRMPPTELLIVGNPVAGTPAMLAQPSVAIDLPLKILIAEDEQGAVWVSYNTAEYLRARHGLSAEYAPALGAAGEIARTAAE